MTLFILVAVLVTNDTVVVYKPYAFKTIAACEQAIVELHLDENTAQCFETKVSE